MLSLEEGCELCSVEERGSGGHIFGLVRSLEVFVQYPIKRILWVTKCHLTGNSWSGPHYGRILFVISILELHMLSGKLAFSLPVGISQISHAVESS